MRSAVVTIARVARYRQIYEDLREQILSGLYGPGDQLPTELQLAARYGVSRVTSAAALTELAREGLVRRAPRRGTRVSLDAGHARGAARPLIAWIQPHIDHAFGLNLLRGVEEATRNAGYNLLIHLTGHSREEEEHAIRNALDAGASGLALFLQDGETYNAEVLRLVLDHFPLVLVDRYLRGVHCATVQSDNEAGACDLVAELARAGHRHICALVFPSKGTSTIEDRLDGYTRALSQAGIPLDLSLIYEDHRLYNMGYSWLIPDDDITRFVEYLRGKPEISAAFASNSLLALLVLRAAERLGLHIPDDLSVVCIDAVQAYPLTLPTFTGALQQGFEIGMTAIGLLQEQLDGKPPRRVTLPMHIEHAGTVAPPRARVAT